VEKIQKMLKDKGLETPSFSQRGKINDQAIARCMREIVGHGIVTDTMSLLMTSENEVRNLISKILSEDKMAQDKIIEFKKKKGWLFDPPIV